MAKAGVVFTKDNEYYTPFDFVARFGKFDYDPATTKEKAEEFGIKEYDTIETDGLKADWTPYKRIWINPPFTIKHEFLKKAVETFAKTKADVKGYDLATDGDGIDLAYPDSKTRRGRVGHGVSKTLPTSDSQGVMDGYRIRKLTPLECWRLMGFDDTDFHKAEKVNSNTQLYKQAGNSIVVNVLEAILKELL